MHFHSGPLMYFRSGVDSSRCIRAREPQRDDAPLLECNVGAGIDSSPCWTASGEEGSLSAFRANGQDLQLYSNKTQLAEAIQIAGFLRMAERMEEGWRLGRFSGLERSRPNHLTPRGRRLHSSAS